MSSVEGVTVCDAAGDTATRLLVLVGREWTALRALSGKMSGGNWDSSLRSTSSMRRDTPRISPLHTCLEEGTKMSILKTPTSGFVNASPPRHEQQYVGTQMSILKTPTLTFVNASPPRHQQQYVGTQMSILKMPTSGLCK